MSRRKNSPKKPAGSPLVPLGDAPRLVLLEGLHTPSGGPVVAVATGPARRPVLTALVSFASLAAPRVDGGAA
ncbi:hypothetical protein [Sediminicoccus sp. BL-A-41-H5]|uniref:hypothetical protein n=1 Tax=Sediminicoccus sp. BL-A-41-H5 TaxID=3421106 RepID=UPI003D66FC3B